MLAEIGKDEIISASSFVDYISDQYLMPKSTAWYVLRKLKDRGMIDFASKDEVGKPLQLTRKGLRELSGLCANASRTALSGVVQLRYYTYASENSEYWEGTQDNAERRDVRRTAYGLG